MSNLDVMKSYLNKLVIEPLLKQGFSGKWPHYRRFNKNYTELLSFQTNKYGGSFRFELSAVFPFAKETNITKQYNSRNFKTLTVWDTDLRYTSKGMYDGWFYYSDLYGKRTLFFGRVYHNVNEKEAKSFIPVKNYKLIKKFDAQTAEHICHTVNKQLTQGFKWLDRFIKNHRQ